MKKMQSIKKYISDLGYFIFINFVFLPALFLGPIFVFGNQEILEFLRYLLFLAASALALIMSFILSYLIIPFVELIPWRFVFLFIGFGLVGFVVFFVLGSRIDIINNLFLEQNEEIDCELKKIRKRLDDIERRLDRET